MTEKHHRCLPPDRSASRTWAQKEFARPAMEKLTEIAMGTLEKANAVQVSALRELLDQALGRPYAPVAIEVNPHDEVTALIEQRGRELRARLDRMASAALDR
jgi:hypothetical protein